MDPPILDFIGTFDNPTPTGIDLGIVFTGILLMGWYRQAIFLALTVGIGNAMNAFIGDYVVRPRPSPALVHVDVSLKFNSFPSGHCCHVMLFYGFMLCLSLTRSVRRWRYRWALIPLQVFAALNILLKGFSRVYEGEHWLFDVLSGYLSGALWLVLFICLYQWTTSVLDRRHAKRAGFTFLGMDELERYKKMQNRMMREHSLGITIIVMLLTTQTILGLFFSLPLLAELLAPGRPVIVSGVAIFAGPAGGIALVVALASPIIAWGVWRVKVWAHQRVVLLEICSLAIGAFELFEPGINRIACLAYIILAALLLICLYAGPNRHARSRT